MGKRWFRSTASWKVWLPYSYHITPLLAGWGTRVMWGGSLYGGPNFKKPTCLGDPKVWMGSLWCRQSMVGLLFQKGVKGLHCSKEQWVGRYCSLGNSCDIQLLSPDFQEHKTQGMLNPISRNKSSGVYLLFQKVCVLQSPKQSLVQMRFS